MKRRQFDAKVIAERLIKWQALSPAAQIKELDQRLGPGQGAKKQRARILKGAPK